ncbi:hypothetical protein [Burkholderia contaminans]|uniref:hypothetical protein n=1 Tax=Burkholderia contaminans TaxID=488447 RepID=UPI00158EA09D|nr:hypothetical protein [Burkholderia contaminans]
MSEEANVYPLSPTVQMLKDQGDKCPLKTPADEIACARCPKAMWHASNSHLKCYCRVMFMVTWTTEQTPPGDIILCDGAVEKEDDK